MNHIAIDPTRDFFNSLLGRVDEFAIEFRLGIPLRNQA